MPRVQFQVRGQRCKRDGGGELRNDITRENAIREEKRRWGGRRFPHRREDVPEVNLPKRGGRINGGLLLTEDVALEEEVPLEKKGRALIFHYKSTSSDSAP